MKHRHDRRVDDARPLLPFSRHIMACMALTIFLTMLAPPITASACLSREARARQRSSHFVPELQLLFSAQHTIEVKPWQALTRQSFEPGWQVLLLWQPLKLISPLFDDVLERC